MAHKDELIGAKMNAALASAFGDDKTEGASGAGTTQVTATAIAATITNVTTAGANTGVILPTASGKSEYVVMNNGANPLKVYPAVGERINGGAANAAFTVTNAKCAVFKPINQEWYAVLSA